MSLQYLNIQHFVLIHVAIELQSLSCYHYNSTILAMNKLTVQCAWELSFSNLFQCNLMHCLIAFIPYTFYTTSTDVCAYVYVHIINAGNLLIVVYIKWIGYLTKLYLRDSLELHLEHFNWFWLCNKIWHLLSHISLQIPFEPHCPDFPVQMLKEMAKGNNGGIL